MKAKKIALFAGLATMALVTIGQESNPSPPPPPPAEALPPNVAPPPPPPAEAVPPSVAPAPAAQPDLAAPKLAQATPAAPAENKDEKPATPPRPDEVVPLIVIDDVPLTDAIRNLARQAGLNFQFDPRITAVGADGRPTNAANVSIRFENVTAQEALDAVLDNYGLKLVKEPRAKIARVTLKDPKAEEPLVSTVVQLKYADPTNIITVVKSTLSQRATVVADPRTAQVIITATAKELDAATNLIVRLDLATRQVLIEAQLLETTVNPNSVKGIDWSGTFGAQNFRFGNSLSAADPAAPRKGPLVPGTFPKLLADTSRGFNPATAFLDADGVSAVLSFLNKDTDTEVVATPRAVTLDNQMATLSVTRAFPIFNITPGSANSPAGSTLLYTNLGTILHVTPRIAADDNISLKVEPEVSNIDTKDTQLFQDQVNTANIYAIRRMETTVMIPSGNTLVLGGLINDTTTKTWIKVPILGDLPGVGLAFRHESKDRKKSNLLIFITPTIIQDGDFQKSTRGREFLATRQVDKLEKPLSAWDSGKPHDWTKPVY